jgi:hypothetical protein
MSRKEGQPENEGGINDQKRHAEVIKKKNRFGFEEVLGVALLLTATGTIVKYCGAEHPVTVTRVNPPEKVATKKVENNSKEIVTDPEKVREYIVNMLGAEKAGNILLNSGVYPVYSCTYKGRKIFITPYSVDGQGIYNDSLWSAQPITFTVGKIQYVATVINPLKW